ncbi:MAG: hypothetical protein ABL956_14445 [Hyphomonadaceae bacterium]
MSRARHLFSTLAVILLVNATFAEAQTTSKPKTPSAKVVPTYSKEAIAKDLIVSCVPEAAAFVRAPFWGFGTNDSYERLSDAKAREALVSFALAEANRKRPLSSSTPKDLMRDARRERAKGGAGPTAEALYTYRACIALRNSDIEAGSPLRTKRPMSNGVPLASKLPPMQAGASSSNAAGLQPEAPKAAPPTSQANNTGRCKATQVAGPAKQRLSPTILDKIELTEGRGAIVLYDWTAGGARGLPNLAREDQKGRIIWRAGRTSPGSPSDQDYFTEVRWDGVALTALTQSCFKIQIDLTTGKLLSQVNLGREDPTDR